MARKLIALGYDHDQRLDNPSRRDSDESRVKESVRALNEQRRKRDEAAEVSREPVPLRYKDEEPNAAPGHEGYEQLPSPTEGRIEGDETDQILNAADIVTMARTAVERDYRGDVIDAHAPEMPTRFAKQLTQMVRGAVAVGMTRKEALRLELSAVPAIPFHRWG
jgi:hypothetical protein